MAGKRPRHKPGLFSRRGALKKLDGRTREAVVVRTATVALIDHLGGPERVTAPQRMLAESCGLIVLRTRLAVERMATGRGDLEVADRHLIALINALRANLVVLGIERVDQVAPGLGALLVADARRVA